MGSAITYARRYALTSMLGIITEDDDGEAAKLPTNKKSNIKATQDLSKPSLERNINSYNSSTPYPPLPELDGVVYQYAFTQDGRQCVFASGNTQANKNIVRENGFFWNPQRKVWWKYIDAA